MKGSEGEALPVFVRRTSVTAPSKQTWRRVAGGLSAALLALLVVVSFSKTQDEAPTRREADELTLRSATLTIKDLANEYDLENHFGEGKEGSFSFCGKSVLSLREVRLCAERFLSLLSGHVQGKVKEQSSQLWGLPHLTAYSRCTSARSIYQVKVCIRSVTSALTKRAIIQHQRVGASEFDEGLQDVAKVSIKNAKPDNPTGGLNGGMAGEISEVSNSKYLEARERAAREGPPEGMVPGCEMLGVNGCESAANGGLRPSVKERALNALREHNTD